MGRLIRGWCRLGLESGQTMAEYALVIGVIALVVILAAVLFGNNASSTLHSTAGYL